MKTMLTAIIISLFLTLGCNSSKQSTAPPAQSEAAQTVSDSPVAPQTNDDGSTTSQEGVVYRVIVSFISIGEGSDYKSYENLKAILTNWHERVKTEIEVVEIPWGREGEVDVCLTLKELTPEEQASFVDEIKTTFQGNNLVQISENQKGRLQK